VTRKDGILGGQTIERDAHLFLVGLGLGLDRQLDHRLGEFHPLQDDRLALGAQRIAGGGFLHAGQSDDVAGISRFDVFTAVGMHQQHAADLFLLVLDRVQIGALGQGARINAQEGQRTDERVVHDLERQAREGRVVRRLAAVGLLGVGVDALHVGDVERRRQIVDDRVEQRLHALVLECRAAQDRRERLAQRALADQLLERGGVRQVAFQIGFHRVVVLLDGEFDQLFAIFGGLVGEIAGISS